MHPQVMAPGNHMHIIWVICHLPGDPWSRGPDLTQYQRLENSPEFLS